MDLGVLVKTLVKFSFLHKSIAELIRVLRYFKFPGELLCSLGGGLRGKCRHLNETGEGRF